MLKGSHDNEKLEHQVRWQDGEETVQSSPKKRVKSRSSKVVQNNNGESHKTKGPTIYKNHRAALAIWFTLVA